MTFVPTISSPGQVNATGAVDALFLKQFSGEVMTAFERANVMLPLVTQRTISNGKSAQFPTVGLATAKYHTPGQSLLDSGNAYGTAFKQGSATLTIDDLLVSTTFVPEIEELENHYDVRSRYAVEMGRALAYEADKQLLRLAAKSVTTADDNTDLVRLPSTLVNGAITNSANGCLVDTNFASATVNTVLTAVYNAIWTTAKVMDEGNVPADDRFIVVRPDLFYRLYNATNSTTIVPLHDDIGNGANGSLMAPAKAIKFAGFTIISAARAAQAGSQFSVVGATANGENISAGPTKYRVNLGGVVGVAFHRSTLGTLKLMDLSVQSEYNTERQGTLMVARYAMGHGILRADASYVWKSADTAL